MKKLLILLIVFIIQIQNITFAESLNQYDLDDFVCSYYSEMLEQVDVLIDSKEYKKAKEVIEELYNSKCRTDEVVEKYLRVLNLNRQYNDAYKIASENNLLDSEAGQWAQSNIYIAEKDSTQARSVYDNILIKSSYDKFAQMGLNQSYISTNSELKGLKELAKLPSSYETDFLTAKAYYNLELFEDSIRILNGMQETDEVLHLKNEINRKRAYQIVSGYEIYIQKLNEEFKLDANKFAISNSCYHKNMQVYLDYILFLYTSGRLAGQGPEPKTNLTNEIRLGTQGRLTENIALRGDLGVKVFQDRGAMLLTNSWVKYYFNDSFNVKVGFHRNNSEQTFLSAVGVMIDNKFTGQIADNNLYLDATYRLPKRAYMFTKTGIGIKEGDNIDANGYWEGMAGIGKLLRYDLTKPYLQKASVDLVTYNSGYQKNLEKIYDSQGALYGGYFSPIWFSDNTVNLNFAGRIWNKFSYGYGAFAGWQFAIEPDNTMFIYGGSVYGQYRANDHLSMEAQYRYYRYANVVRNQLIFDVVISLFKKEGAKK